MGDDPGHGATLTESMVNDVTGPTSASRCGHVVPRGHGGVRQVKLSHRPAERVPGLRWMGRWSSPRTLPRAWSSAGGGWSPDLLPQSRSDKRWSPMPRSLPPATPDLPRTHPTYSPAVRSVWPPHRRVHDRMFRPPFVASERRRFRQSSLAEEFG